MSSAFTIFTSIYNPFHPIF